MTKKANEKSDLETTKEEMDPNKKTCFIIMPISDHTDYAPGHFKRVYEHIIKPACEAEGFTPIRADDVKSTNYIALDIVQKIIESDMAICDLSSKNPNVLYEVGIRQAFNKPVTFIKDKITPRIFDIQGFRDVSYDQSLRIDTVDTAVTELSETLINTFNGGGGINSLISLLGINAATVEKKEISLDTEIILNAIKSIQNEPAPKIQTSHKYFTIPDNFRQLSVEEIKKLKVGDKVYHLRKGWSVVKESFSTENKYMKIDYGNGTLSVPISSQNMYIE